MRAVLRVVIALTLAYAALCEALFVYQRSLIYFPQPGLSDSSVVKMMLETGGERLQVSIRPHGGRRALMYFGGNAEDVSLNMPDFASAFPDEAIYLLNYRGYGEVLAVRRSMRCSRMVWRFLTACIVTILTLR
jgi:hypothetical protein